MEMYDPMIWKNKSIELTSALPDFRNYKQYAVDFSINSYLSLNQNVS